MKKYIFKVCSLCIFSLSVFGHSPVHIDTLRGVPQGGFGDFFGDHIDVDGTWLIIGAPREDIDLDGNGDTFGSGERDTGAVYIYRRTTSGQVLHQKIEGEGNNVLGFGDRLGAGVSLQGDWLFVGSSNDDQFPGLSDPTPEPGRPPFSFAGKVYVFHYNADKDLWELTQKLTSDNPNSGGSFGARTDSSHVALYSFGSNPDAKIALIGEVENGTGIPPQIHVFKLNHGIWERVQTAESPSGSLTSGFADSVTRVGKLALVPESNGDVSPRVYVYRINPNGIVKLKGKLQPLQTLLSLGIHPDCHGGTGT